MQKKILGSFVIAGFLLSGINAADFNVFGHIGGFYDKGFGKANEVIDAKDGKSKTADYVGLTAQLGLDIGFGDFHIGAAGWGAFPIWGSPTKFLGQSNYAEHMYTTKYADISDLYIKYDGKVELAIGRFDSEFLESDWIVGHIQGVALKKNRNHFSPWAAWVNDFSAFGYQPNRLGSELSSFRRYSSSFNNFDIGEDLIAGGVNIDFGRLKIDPFVHYYLGGHSYGSKSGSHSMIQAGTKVALELGSDNGIKSITSFRFMWQNIFKADNDDTTLFWIDEELRFNDMFKIGGGWYIVGKNNGIFTLNDHTRFYASRYLTGDRKNSYFFGDETSWYAFTGLEMAKSVNIDVLYADGDYKEFSAIVSWNIFDTKGNRGGNGYGLQIGGGYVSNGFQGKKYQQNNAVVFAKVFF